MAGGRDAIDRDVELLQRWREGDAAAGNELVTRLFPMVYRFFANKVGRGIEDLVQRTFVACVEARDRLPEHGALRAYVLTIARRQLYQHFATKQRHATPLGELSVEALEGSPSAVVAAHEEQRVLLHALRQIPVDFQIALELYYWEDLSVGEIATVLEIAEGTVRSRLTRGRQLLKKRIPQAAAFPELAQSTINSLESWARSLRDLASRTHAPDEPE